MTVRSKPVSQKDLQELKEQQKEAQPTKMSAKTAKNMEFHTKLWEEEQEKAKEADPYAIDNYIPAAIEPDKAEEVAIDEETNYLDSFTGRTFKLFDGRVIEMGPPALCHQLVLADMFADIPVVTIKTQQNEKLAKVMQYVRSVDNQKLPAYLKTWPEVVHLCNKLGALGVNAVQQVWMETWPDINGLYWSDVKKNLPK